MRMYFVIAFTSVSKRMDLTDAYLLDGQLS